jgi:ABC-2 type transport system permease protein
MTTTTTAPAPTEGTTLARPAGFGADVWHLASREVRALLRTPFALIPALVIPMFFFFVNVGSLSELTSFAGVANAKNFFLPVSILFAVSNGGAGLRMVEDIESGYFDKLLLTPARRLAILIGSMGADFARTLVQATLVLLVGWVAGADLGLGPAGAGLLVLVAALWGLVYGAIGYAIALKTGNSQATQSAFVVFFPFVFITTSFAPREALSGWFATAASLNPVTYVLAGLRSLLEESFDAGALLAAPGAIAAVGAVTLTLAFRAMRGRAR